MHFTSSAYVLLYICFLAAIALAVAEPARLENYSLEVNLVVGDRLMLGKMPDNKLVTVLPLLSRL